jgi:FAD/FMN-containing dehydrogenase
MMREQVLGLEAVLADGTVISSMNDVIKNNTGYDLKQLFIGSEGTLGVVTRAVLRLRPRPRSRNTALVAIEDFERLSAFLTAADAALGGTLSAFEVMWNDFWTLVVSEGSKHGRPLGGEHAFYVLLESTGGDPEGDPQRFEATLAEAFESALISDALIAQSGQQREDLWAIRDDIDTLFEKLNPPKAFDVSLAIPLLADYVEEVRAALAGLSPPVRMVTFGHLGDGNIHLVMKGSTEAERAQALERVVYESLGRRGGVISAEHGIGLEKRPYLQQSRSPEEIALMQTMKSALDPGNILNPGKILEPRQGSNR